MKAKSMTKCLCQYTLLILIAAFLPFLCTSLSAFERCPGTLFPPNKIFLLEEPRDWQDTEEILDRLRIKPGDIIADIGAGSGYFTIPLASRVGDKGIVFAEEVQIEMVNQILLAKENNHDAEASAMEAEIDQIVYKLYGLTPEEIKIVEGEK